MNRKSQNYDDYYFLKKLSKLLFYKIIIIKLLSF